jgi:hypothetical protein
MLEVSEVHEVWFWNVAVFWRFRQRGRGALSFYDTTLTCARCRCTVCSAGAAAGCQQGCWCVLAVGPPRHGPSRPTGTGDPAPGKNDIELLPCFGQDIASRFANCAGAFWYVCMCCRWVPARVQACPGCWIIWELTLQAYWHSAMAKMT